MTIDAPIELKLSDDLTDEVKVIVTRRVQDAVAGSWQRDKDLLVWDELFHAVPSKVAGPWKNSCNMEDPLIRQQHTELLAPTIAPMRRELLVQVNACYPQDEDKARRQETWIAHVMATEGFARYLYFFIHDLLYLPGAVMYIGWKQEIEDRRKTMYHDGKTWDSENDPVLIEEDQRDPAVEYDEYPVTEEDVKYEGRHYRNVNLHDFYVYPSDAQSIESAVMVMERMYLSEDELLEGIERFGYDKNEVYKLIEFGPTFTFASNNSISPSDSINPDDMNNSSGMNYQSVRNMRTVKDLRDGVAGTGTYREDGLYECFLVFGKLPKMWNEEGSADLPKKYWKDDVSMMVCPRANIVFKMDISPYTQRPYFIDSMLPETNRLLGTALAPMLETIQAEATHWTRSTFNALDIQIQPAFYATPDWLAEYSAWKIGPGLNIPRQTPGDHEPIVMPQTAQLGFESLQHLFGRAQKISATQGYGELAQKNRTNAEMQNLMAATDVKFDLYVSNGYFVLTLIAPWIVALELQFRGSSFDKQEIQGRGGSIEVTVDDLKGKFIYVPATNASATNPEQRAARNDKKLQMQAAYIAAIQNAPPEFHSMIWHGFREGFLDAEERTPEDWIGPEPPSAQELAQQQALQPTVPSVQSAIPGGIDPGAIAQQAGQMMNGGMPPMAMNGMHA